MRDPLGFSDTVSAVVFERRYTCIDLLIIQRLQSGYLLTINTCAINPACRPVAILQVQRCRQQRQRIGFIRT